MGSNMALPKRSFTFSVNKMLQMDMNVTVMGSRSQNNVAVSGQMW